MLQKTLPYILTVAACSGLAASSIGICTNAMGIFYTPVSEELGVGRGAFALHATIAQLVSGFITPLVARLLPKYPLRPLLLCSVLPTCLSTALMAFAQNMPSFYILGFFRGIGMGFFSLMPVTAILNNWFHARHGLAVGIALSCSGLSGAVFNPVFSAIIADVGWQTAYLLMALFVLLLALPGVFLLRFTPAEKQLSPYGGTAATPSDSVPQSKTAIPWCTSLFLLCGFTILHTSITGIAQHLTGYADSIGLGLQTGAAMVSACMVGNIATKLLIGILSDKIGPFRAAGLMILTNAGALTALALLPGTAAVPFLAAAFFYGSVYSVGAVGIPLITRRIFGPARYASAYSVLTILTNVGSASALTVIGLLYDVSGSYRTALWGGLILDGVNLGLLTLLAIRKKYGKDLDHHEKCNCSARTGL